MNSSYCPEYLSISSIEVSSLWLLGAQAKHLYTAGIHGLL